MALGWYGTPGATEDEWRGDVMSNITPELCEALSRLTYDEWGAVKTAVDDGFRRVSGPLYDDLHKRLGSMTCDATGAELSELCAAIDR